MTPPADDGLDQARKSAGLSPNQLWMRYFGLGGMSGAVELDAMCHGAMIPSGQEHDLIAHALNERFTELGRNHPVPYTEDEPDLGP
jgi:hypothetical protein